MSFSSAQLAHPKKQSKSWEPDAIFKKSTPALPILEKPMEGLVSKCHGSMIGPGMKLKLVLDDKQNYFFPLFSLSSDWATLTTLEREV